MYTPVLFVVSVAAFIAKFVQLAALDKAEASLFTIDAKLITETQETITEGCIFQAHQSDPEAPFRKHQKSYEVVAAGRHEDMFELFHGIRIAIVKLAKDQGDLSTK